MSRATSRLRNQRGFTLPELLVAAAVIALVMAGVLVIQQEGLYAYLLGSNRVEAQQNIRVALDLITRDLRTASPSAAAPTGIVSIPSATDITLRDQCGNNVQYTLLDGTLNRTGPDYTDQSNCIFDTTSTTLLIGDGSSLTMTYYSDVNAGNTTADPTKVTAVKISITSQTDEGMVASGSATMECTVTLRATLA